MLVKCAVQVNQCYEEINLTQFLLLMNFSISCELWSVLVRQSSSSSSFAASVSHGSVTVSPCEEGMGCMFLWRAVSPGHGSEHGLLVSWICRWVWAELECKHPKVRQAEPGTVTAAQGLPLSPNPNVTVQ